MPFTAPASDLEDAAPQARGGFRAPEDEMEVGGFRAPEDEIEGSPPDSGQSRLASSAASLAQGAVGLGLGFYGGGMKTLDRVQALAEGLPGIPEFRRVKSAVESVPGLGAVSPTRLVPERPFARAAGFLDDVQEHLPYAYPENPAFPRQNALLQGTGQAAALIGLSGGTAAVPLAIGAVSGMGQGIDAARDMGVSSPAGQLATGAGFGAIEAGSEAMFGIGSKAAQEALLLPVKKTLRELAKSGVKTVLGEGAEEIAAGGAQDALQNLIAARDPARPGYSTTGEIIPFGPADTNAWQRREMEAIGGMGGGAFFTGVDVAANALRPAAPEPPPLPPSATAPEPDFTVPDPLAGIIPAPAARAPILQDVPDRRMPILQDVPDRDPFAAADAIATLPAVTSQTSDPFAAPPLQDSPSPSLPPSPSASVNARNASPEPPFADSPERVAGSTPAAGTSFPQTTTGSNVQTGTEMPVPDEPTVASPGGDLPPAQASAPAVRGESWQASPEFEQAEALAMAGDIEGADALEAAWSSRQAAPPAGQHPAGAALRAANAALPATAQAKWTPGVYAAADAYFTSGDESVLGALSPVQRRRVIQARLAADPAAAAAQDAADRRMEKRQQAQDRSEQQMEKRDRLRREQAETWADEIIDDARGRASMGIDPRLMAAYAIKGARLLESGLRDFASWSRAMLEKFGAAIRAHLGALWQHITTREMPRLGGGRVRVRRAEGGFIRSGSGGQRETRSRFARPDAEERLHEVRSDAGVRAAAAKPSATHGYNNIITDDATRAEAERGVEIFARQWGAPRGAQVPVRDDVPLNPRVQGEFQGSPVPSANYIALKPGADAFVMAHELAHHADYQAGPRGTYWSHEPTGPMKKLMGRLNNGPTSTKLNASVRAWRGSKRNRITEGHIDFTNYLDRQEERFARAVEQATRMQEGAPLREGLGWLTEEETRAILPLLQDVFRTRQEQAQRDRAATAAAPENGAGTGTMAGGLVSSASVRAASAAGPEAEGLVEPDEIKLTPDHSTGGLRAVNGSASTDEIKLTHAAVDERREARGAEPIPHGGQGTIAGWKAEAAARLAAAPGAAPALVSDLIAKNRAHDNVEYFMLENYAAALDVEIAQTSAVLADPLSTAEAREQAAQRKLHAEAERDRVEIASALSGSRAGAALGSRRNALARGEVPPLANMVADITLIQDPSGQTPLPPEERAEIEKVHAEMSAAKAKADKKNEQGSRDAYHTELERLLKEAQAETEALRAAQAATAGKPAGRVRKLIKSWIDDGEAALDELRDLGFFRRANMGLDPTVLGKLARVARGWLARGLDITAEAVKNFGDGIREHLPAILKAAQDKMTDGQPAATVATVKQRARAQLAKGKDIPATFARNLALAHIADHLARKDHTLSAEKIAALVQQDLAEFIPGVSLRDARDAISGYGKATYPSKDEARKTLRDLAAQMQKITQIEALRKQEPLLKSGPQRDPPSARQRELTKLLEELKRETGYESRSREDELKSIRDRIKTTLENQIEDLQRVLSGKARPAAPRERIAYDAELQALQTLRNSLKELAAEMPEHKLASEARRNKAALKSAQASEAEWNRRAKAQEWKRPGKSDVTYTAEVEAARAAAKAARANFEALKKAANPANDPEAAALRNFKSATQRRINELNRRMKEGEFDPPKKTKREIKHDTESTKLKHELELARRKWQQMKLDHKFAMMGIVGKSVEVLRVAYRTAWSILTSIDLGGVLRQGGLKLMTTPGRYLFNDIPAMLRGMKSEEGETGVLDAIHARQNAINGNYNRAKLAIHNLNDAAGLSEAMAEGAARSRYADKIWGVAHSTRAYTTLLTHMRADLFDHLLEKFERRNKRAATDAELRTIADHVNDITGAGKLPFKVHLTGRNLDLLGAFFFAPKWLASRFRVALGVNLLLGNNATRRLLLPEYLKIWAGYAALYALMAMLFGDDDANKDMFNPLSGGFGKIPITPRTSIDPSAGLAPVITFLARQALTRTMNGKGEIVRTVGDERPFNGRTPVDIAARFARGKLSPAAHVAVDWWWERDFNNRKFDPARAAFNMAVPMSPRQIYDPLDGKGLLQTEPPEIAIPLSAAALLGVGTQNNDWKARKREE